MLYRTKATMEILMDLTAKEALELLKMVKHIQKRTYIGTRMIPFDAIQKDDAHDRIQCILNDGTLDIPAQLKGPLERFLEVMVEERAPMDMLVEEYNTALSRVFQPDLFRQETTEDNLPDRPEPVPEASAKGPDISSSGTIACGGETGSNREDTETLQDTADKIVSDLVDRGLTFSDAFSVLKMVERMIESGQAGYCRRLRDIPIKELKRMREVAGI